MTAEICLMNRFAAVLAADSATTVSYYDATKKQRVERYFKGANKIFQLSNLHPVGMMINDNVELYSVPWEVIVKEFRSHLKDKALPNPEAYAMEFFDFIRGHTHLIPSEFKEEQFKYHAARLALMFLWEMEENAHVKDARDDALKKSIIRAEFDRRRTRLNETSLPPHFQSTDLQGTTAAYNEEIGKTITAYLQQESVSTDVTALELAEFGIETLFKNYKESLRDLHSGIVIVGYGEHDFFPSYIEYDCYGFILSHLLIDKGSTAEINHKVTAEIKAFAQTSMVDTFQLGLSADVYVKLRAHTDQALRELVGLIQTDLGGQEVTNLEAHIKTVEDHHFSAWLREASDSHRSPLYQVIGNLPVTEMASLAESLISLQSLKEKVTKPSETVGGPIDVAVITKSEGLVWVKRKHFFDPNMNPRFFMRQRAQYN